MPPGSVNLRKRPIKQEPEVVQLPDLSPTPELEVEPESEEPSRATNIDGIQRAYPRRAHVQPNRYEPGLFYFVIFDYFQFL